MGTAWTHRCGGRARPERDGEQHGLTRSDVAALIVVTEANEGGTTIGTVELARRIGLTAPSATVLVDCLITAGLLARRPHPSDRRRVVLTLTPAALVAGREHLRIVNDQLLRKLATHSAADLRAADAYRRPPNSQSCTSMTIC